MGGNDPLPAGPMANATKSAREDLGRYCKTLGTGEIYDWFTQGFATKDLQEAKALLEGLA